MPPWNLREPRRPFLRFALLTAIASAAAQHAVVDDVRFRIPAPKPGLDEARQSLRRMSLPPGWTGSVWAAEPDVTHPVAFDVADDGRVFVAESLRAWRGVQDIRPLPDWLDEDIASKSVEDRLAMMRRHLGEEGLESFRRNTERVRLLNDTDGNGVADRSVVFAEGFNTPLDGVASSVLARGNEVWFANIPDVWWLRDADGDGRADERRSLSHGHGVRISMLGHDLHGLAWGPDGRIYVSVGDRGSRVFHDGRWHGNPESGAVFRFEPDGTQGNGGPVGYAAIKDGRYSTTTAGSKGSLQGPIVAYLTGGPAPDPKVEFPQLWFIDYRTTFTLEPRRGTTTFDIDVPASAKAAPSAAAFR